VPDIVVTPTDPPALPLDELVAALRQAGMRIDAVLTTIGLVTGSVPEEGLSRVRAVHGVADVSSSVGAHIPPPDSPVQ
jgi:hypothetical protein